MKLEIFDFVKFLIESIQDSYHSQLNKTAIWALGQIIENTGYVIEPYKKYPNLLQTLLTILQKENSKQTRHDTIKAPGLIGSCFRFNRRVF
jgi:FKBP12-rapamycin complex-associated protein